MSLRNWKRISIWTFLVLGLPLGIITYSKYSNDSAYEEQLRLARKEGLPTNASEYAALIPPAKPSENAAPLYQSLKISFRAVDQVQETSQELCFAPDSKSIAKSEAILVSYGPQLALIDRAVELPRCWFNRDWKLGIAVLFPEYAIMKSAAKLISLRGSLAARKGDVRSALADAGRMLVIAKHASEEPHAISRLVGESIESMALSDLAAWALIHPQQRQYQRALADAVRGMKRPNQKEELSAELFGMLSAIELCSTSSGRSLIGLKKADVPIEEIYMPIVANRWSARVRLVEAMRLNWSAIDKPKEEQKDLMKQASEEMNSALAAYPTVNHVYMALGNEDDLWISTRQQRWEAKRQKYQALLRALQGDRVAKSIETADLLSPFDGKPIRYRFDGKQIVITVSGESTSTSNNSLRIPPDKLVQKRPSH